MDIELIYSKVHLFLAVFFVICLLVIGAIMLDLWDGVHTARVTSQRVHSHKLRVTITKMSEYFRFIMIGFLVDCIGFLFAPYTLPYVAVVFGVGLIVVEAKSMFEHANRRKSHTKELPDIIKSIIECAHDKDAKKLVKQIQSQNTPTTH